MVVNEQKTFVTQLKALASIDDMVNLVGRIFYWSLVLNVYLLLPCT